MAFKWHKREQGMLVRAIGFFSILVFTLFGAHEFYQKLKREVQVKDLEETKVKLATTATKEPTLPLRQILDFNNGSGSTLVSVSLKSASELTSINWAEYQNKNYPDLLKKICGALESPETRDRAQIQKIDKDGYDTLKNFLDGSKTDLAAQIETPTPLQSLMDKQLVQVATSGNAFTLTAKDMATATAIRLALEKGFLIQEAAAKQVRPLADIADFQIADKAILLTLKAGNNVDDTALFDTILKQEITLNEAKEKLKSLLTTERLPGSQVAYHLNIQADIKPEEIIAALKMPSVTVAINEAGIENKEQKTAATTLFQATTLETEGTPVLTVNIKGDAGLDTTRALAQLKTLSVKIPMPLDLTRDLEITPSQGFVLLKPKNIGIELRQLSSLANKWSFVRSSRVVGDVVELDVGRDLLIIELPRPLVWAGIHVGFGLFVAIAMLIIGCWGAFHYFFIRVPSSEFLIDTETEMRKVAWPSKEDAMGATGAVLITVVFFSLFAYGADALFLLVFQLINIY